jgi:hypothetical protein
MEPMRKTPQLALAALALAITVCLSARAAAGDARLVLDGLSFFVFEGAGQSAFLPEGTSVPLEFERLGTTSWQVTIVPSALDAPPVRYPSGKSVTWRLHEPATGMLTVSGGEASWSLSAPLVAYVEGSEAGIPFPLSFTTAVASRTAQGIVASREGARLDLATGYVQLVAAGVSPEGALTAPGMPFIAVLSGSVVGLPAELVEP